MQLNGDSKNSAIFEGQLAAVDLLRSNLNVATEKIGITGVSWGGYTVTMMEGLG